MQVSTHRLILNQQGKDPASALLSDSALLSKLRDVRLENFLRLCLDCSREKKQIKFAQKFFLLFFLQKQNGQRKKQTLSHQPSALN